MEHQLYRQKGFGSFAEYCESVWGFKKSYAYQLVRSAEVMKQLPAQVSTIVETFNPGQVRELVKVPNEQRETVLKAAVTKAKSVGRKLTAKDISDAAKPAPRPAVEVSKDAQVACCRAERKRGVEKWYYNAPKQQRAKLLNFVFFTGCKVEVADKAEFKKRLDRWLENCVCESGGNHE